MKNKSTEKLVTFRLNEIEKFLFEAAKTNKKLVLAKWNRKAREYEWFMNWCARQENKQNNK